MALQPSISFSASKVWVVSLVVLFYIRRMYIYYVKEVVRIVDGDTIDVVLDLGFDIYKKERVRLAGVDTPEKRTRDKEEKALGIDASRWLDDALTLPEGIDLIITTLKQKQSGKYGRMLGWLYAGRERVFEALNQAADPSLNCGWKDQSINAQMIDQGYAWEYDGGTKDKDLQELIDIRNHDGTLERWR